MRSVFWDACPLADHEPRQGHEAGCGEKFLAQVVFDAAQHVFFGAQAVLDDLGERAVGEQCPAAVCEGVVGGVEHERSAWVGSCMNIKTNRPTAASNSRPGSRCRASAWRNETLAVACAARRC